MSIFGMVLLLLGILFGALNPLIFFWKLDIWNTSNVVGTLWVLWVALNHLTSYLWPLFSHRAWSSLSSELFLLNDSFRRVADPCRRRAAHVCSYPGIPS